MPNLDTTVSNQVTSAWIKSLTKDAIWRQTPKAYPLNLGQALD